MTKRQTPGGIASQPWLWLGLSLVIGLGFVYGTRASRPSEQADDRPPVAAPPRNEGQSLPALELPLHVYGSHLAHLCFTSDGRAALAFGSEGAALRSTDDGQSWQAVVMPTRQFLVASVADARSGAIVVVGTRGTILRSGDQGQNFVPVAVDSEGSFRAIARAADGAQILAVGDRGMAYVSRDGGRSFAAEATPRSDYLSYAVALPKRARFVVVGDNGALLLRDEGTGWRSITTTATTQEAGLFMALSVLPSGKLLAATQNGLILSSDDDGETWRETYKTGSDSFAAHFEPSESGSLVAMRMRRGELLLSTDQGVTFESTSLGVKPGVATLSWLPGRGFIGVTGDGGVLSSDLKGGRWLSERSRLSEGPLAMAVHPSTGTVLVVGRSGLIARSTDHGRQYQIVRPSLGGSLRAFADNSAAGCLVGVGLGATVVRSLDAGKSWERVPLDISLQVELTSVVVEPKSRALLAAGSGGTLLRSTDCGRTWTAIRGAKTDLSFLQVGASSVVLALSAKAPAVRSLDGGRVFVPVDMDADATLKRSLALSASEWVAVGDGGRAYHSSDDGKSFQRVVSGTEANLRALVFDPAHRALWAAGDGGTVIRSTDGGASWSRIAVPTEENLFVIGLHPDGSAVWLGGNRGTALRSSDQGEHFASIASGSTQTIRVITFDPISMEFVLAGAGGTLLRTVAGTQISTVRMNLDGRIDAAFFHAPTRALFLGGERLIRLGG